MTKSYLLAALLLPLCATAQTAIYSPVDPNHELMCESMSPNGYYQVGSNFVTFAPTIWNVTNDEVYDYPEYEEGFFHAINNQGVAVGDDGDYAIIRHADGTVHYLYYEEGKEVEGIGFDGQPYTYYTGDAGSNAYAVSEDGRTVAGFYFDTNYCTSPCIWRDSVRITLPLPSEEELGYPMMGGEARWITPDAKVIAGFIFDSMSLWPAIIWRLNAEGGYDYEVVSQQWFEANYGEGKPYMLFTPNGLSENGEWLSLTIEPEYSGWTSPGTQAARLNLKTSTLEVLTLDDGLSYTPYGIANDGSCLLVSFPQGQEQGMIGRNGHLWQAGQKEPQSLCELLPDEDYLSEIANIALVPGAISADGRLIQGFGIDSSSSIISFVLDLNTEGNFLEGITKPVLKIVQHTGYDIMGRRISTQSGQPSLRIENGQKLLR